MDQVGATWSLDQVASPCKLPGLIDIMLINSYVGAQLQRKETKGIKDVQQGGWQQPSLF